MTRRIALAILLSACATMIAAGVAAYFVVRQVVIAELDQQLVERAATVLRNSGMVSEAAPPQVPVGDRYLIRTDDGRTLARPVDDRPPSDRPIVVARDFARTAEEGRVRTLTLRWAPIDASGRPATIVYSSPALAYDTVLASLAATITLVTSAGVAVTALVARRVAARATRPLADTAEAIGEIDEANLARRIDVASLPDELRPVGARLNEMLERLERSSAQRHRFMVDAAHELRTPVAALRTTIEVALDGPRADAARALERCLASARLLDRLVSLLTETLRDAPAAGDLPLTPVNAGRLVRDCAAQFEALAAQKRQTLVVDSPDDRPMESDPDKLRSIAINLIGNALEYTPEGGRVEVWAGVAGDGTWRLTVRDDGPGISAEHQRRVFDPFFRADAARQRRSSHLGLGLYLVQSHARRLGGTCTLRSEPGAGAEFTVGLPARLLHGGDIVDDIRDRVSPAAVVSSSLQERGV